MIGDVPLAVLLWKGGMSFGGVGLIPNQADAKIPGEGITWNCTTWPDIAFLLPDLWAQVARLAPLTGPTPVPESKQPLYRFERDKVRCGRAHAACLRRRTAASGGQAPSKCRPGRSRSHRQEGRFFSVETEAIRVHADERIVVPGTYHLDPVLWSPLIYDFRHGGSALPYVQSPEVFQQERLVCGEVAFLDLRPLREGPTCAVPLALPHTRTGATVPRPHTAPEPLGHR
ncbi:hypothetical protein [Streptomyces mirabilis]|uniref:hypothetical protein n=1 Tax=Streptomyces mirabilis TaxID=68239 RepID=UPI0036DA149D